MQSRVQQLGIRRAWAAGLSLLVLGCAAAPATPDHFYRLVVSSEVPRLETPPFEGTLVVQEIRAQGLAGERLVLFSNRESPNEVGRSAHHYWVDSPPRMLQQLLTNYLRTANLADRVVTPHHRIEADWIASGRVHRLERLLGSEPSVVVEIELALRKRVGSRVLWLNTYRVERAAKNDRMPAAIHAFNLAVDEISGRFVSDLVRAHGH